MLNNLLGPALIALWLAFILLAAVLCRQRWPEQRELSRKIVHIGTGTVLPMAWGFGVTRPLALGFAGLVTLLIACNHRWRWLAAMEDVDRPSIGTIAYAAAITGLLMLFWPDRADAVCAGVLVMAWGDGFAGLLGRAIQSPHWRVFGQTKSVVGTLTMAVVSAVVLNSLGPWSAAGSTLSITLILAAVATGLEQISINGCDNLTVPLVVGLLWAGFVN